MSAKKTHSKIEKIAFVSECKALAPSGKGTISLRLITIAILLQFLRLCQVIVH